MKTLVLDIETRPHLGYVWSIWNDNMPLSGLVESGSVICFAAKWLDKKQVMFWSDHHDGHEAMVRAAWELVDQADAIVHYNGTSFDMKHLSREFLLLGLDPPSPYRNIDLFRAVKSQFKFTSNKLDFVAQQLGLKGKESTGGFQLWVDCMAGDDRAWNKMKKYNVGDVRETEGLYYKILPWIPNHPNVALVDGQAGGCTRCGSKKLMKRGLRHTGAATYQQYQCGDCRGYCRGAKSIDSTAMRGI